MLRALLSQANKRASDSPRSFISYVFLEQKHEKEAEINAIHRRTPETLWSIHLQACLPVPSVRLPLSSSHFWRRGAGLAISVLVLIVLIVLIALLLPDRPTPSLLRGRSELRVAAGSTLPCPARRRRRRRRRRARSLLGCCRRRRCRRRRRGPVPATLCRLGGGGLARLWWYRCCCCCCCKATAVTQQQ